MAPDSAALLRWNPATLEVDSILSVGLPSFRSPGRGPGVRKEHHLSPATIQ